MHVKFETISKIYTQAISGDIPKYANPFTRSHHLTNASKWLSQLVFHKTIMDEPERLVSSQLEGARSRTYKT